MLTFVIFMFFLSSDASQNTCSQLVKGQDHLVNFEDLIFETALLCGSVKNNVGGWSKQHSPKIEILDDQNNIQIFNLSPDGRFEIKLKEGQYCIRFSVLGWQPHILKAHISKKFKARKKHINLNLGN